MQVDMKNTREEKDSIGAVQVPVSKLWGAQTQRSFQNFKIDTARSRMRGPLIHAFGTLKVTEMSHAKK